MKCTVILNILLIPLRFVTNQTEIFFKQTRAPHIPRLGWLVKLGLYYSDQN